MHPVVFKIKTFISYIITYIAYGHIRWTKCHGWKFFIHNNLLNPISSLCFNVFHCSLCKIMFVYTKIQKWVTLIPFTISFIREVGVNKLVSLAPPPYNLLRRRWLQILLPLLLFLPQPPPLPMWGSAQGLRGRPRLFFFLNLLVLNLFLVTVTFWLWVYNRVLLLRLELAAVWCLSELCSRFLLYNYLLWFLLLHMFIWGLICL